MKYNFKLCLLCYNNTSWLIIRSNLTGLNVSYFLFYSLAGCPEAALCNVLGAVQIASQTSVLGVVVALWSGPHHLTPHPFAWPGFIVAAGMAWNTNTHWVRNITTLIFNIGTYLLGIITV
jgi:hypothetical protein